MPKFSQEIEKNTENVPSSKKTKLKIAPSKERYPHKFFYSDIYTYFHQKPNGSQEIEKHTTRKTKKYPKMASRREGPALENCLVQ